MTSELTKPALYYKDGYFHIDSWVSCLLMYADVFILKVEMPPPFPSGKKRRLKIKIWRKLNLRWLKYIRKILNTSPLGKKYIYQDGNLKPMPILYQFEWSDLRNKLFIPLKKRIQNDCPYLRDEKKWDDFMDNGNVYLTNTDDDEEDNEGNLWYAPTLENLVAGKPLDF